ncbi:MAG: HAD family hydrolase [Armatimonadota bacterium]
MNFVFIDRDGVINKDRDDYVKSLDELEIFPYVGKAIKLLNDNGIDVIIISNQQAVAKGLMSEETLNQINQKIIDEIAKYDAKIKDFRYCTHLKEDNCNCRKPKSGLLFNAAKDYYIDLDDTFMIGDREIDMVAGKNAGARLILVLSGFVSAEEASKIEPQPEYIAENLLDAANYIIKHKEIY